MSGFAGEAIGGGPKAIQAWAAGVNAAGGVKCHPVRYIIADDGGDPNRHQTLVQQMVERDKVIAFVYQAAPLSGYSSVTYINQKRVPVIGNEGGSAWFYDNPYFSRRRSAAGILSTNSSSPWRPSLRSPPGRPRSR